MTTISFVACPMCGHRVPTKRTGISAALAGRPVDRYKGIFHFNKMDTVNAQVLQVSECCGHPRDGSPKGFQTIHAEGKTLAELVHDERFSFLADEIYVQAQKIIKEIDNARTAAKQK